MFTKKRFSQKSIPCMLILMLILASLLDIPGKSTVHAAASSNTAKHNSGYLDRNSMELNALRNTNMISLNMHSVKLVKGSSAYLRVLNTPSFYTISFQSSNTKIATVTSYGKITSKKNGTTTIIATIKSNNRTIRKLTCSVEIGPAAVSIVIPKSSLSLKLGKSKQLKYIIKSSNSVEVPTFSTSNKRVATITKNGIIKTQATGKAIITARIANGKYDRITITVTKK